MEETLKKCPKCQLLKALSCFGKASNRKNGVRAYCKLCSREIGKKERSQPHIKQYREEYSKKYRSRPHVKQRILQRLKHRRKFDEDFKEKHIKSTQKYRETHKELTREQSRRYWANKSIEEKRSIIKKRGKSPSYLTVRKRYLQKCYKNPSFRINSNMSHNIYNSLKGQKSGRHWENLVGYTFEQLKEHLEKRFKPGMSWENYGKWVIDHVRPKVSFNIVSAECEDFKKCWALENLQPLWVSENCQKNDFWGGKSCRCQPTTTST